MANNIDRQYKELLEHILVFGNNKNDRTGTGTRSIFGWKIVHRMEEGFPLLTTKKMYTKGIITELLWFLRGDTNIKYLVDNDCHIWDGDAYKNYNKIISNPVDLGTANQYIINGWVNQTKLGWIKYTQEEFINKIKTDNEFAKRFGNLGKIYGYQWRKWNEEIDQISELIKQIKENPDSRRLLVSAWNASDLPHQVLPPCHYGFQVYTRELSWEEQVHWVMKNTDVELENLYIVEEVAKESTPKRAISLMWNQRSVDTFHDLPFNIASYGLLLEIIAKEVNMIPEELIGNLGDVHLYSNHIEQAEELIKRSHYDLPTLKFMKSDDYFRSLSDNPSLITHLDNTDFVMENYQSHPAIKAPLSN